MKKAILIVSFGTSHKEAGANAIEILEREICEKYPQYVVYRAWTSSVIRKKMWIQEGLHIFSVKEAMDQMYKDGIETVVVQPIFVLNGTENENMLRDIHKEKERFQRIFVSTPLLETKADYEMAAEFIIKEWDLAADEMLVYMGHGTDHPSNSAFAMLNDRLTSSGHDNIIIGTMENRPSLEDVIAVVRKSNVRKIKLAPFLLVSGSHASEQMAGTKTDSWKSIFEKEGYEVQCVQKGLGEYEDVRHIFMRHLEDTIEGGTIC